MRPEPRGGRKNKTRKRRTSAPARKKKFENFVFFLLNFVLVRFWAFLGKGSSKTREKKLSTFQKKSPGKYFFGRNFFSGCFFLTSFPFDFFVALVKRLSVRGTQKRDKKVLWGRASNFFPPSPIFC
jgi:hypothetical protein